MKKSLHFLAGSLLLMLNVNLHAEEKQTNSGTLGEEKVESFLAPTFTGSIHDAEKQNAPKKQLDNTGVIVPPENAARSDLNCNYVKSCMP